MNTQDLSKIRIFKNLSSDEFKHLLSLLKEKSYKKNAAIVAVEEPGTSMMFLLEGSVKVNLFSKEGKEIIITSLAEGDFFGEISLLTNTPRSANVVAQTTCKILVLEEAGFNEHISKFPGLSKAMLKELAHRLRLSSKKIEDLALFDVYRRLARTLRGMGTSQKTEGGKEFFIIANRPTHQELAALSGTSREMVTRALKGLEEDGCIKIIGKRLELYKMPI